MKKTLSFCVVLILILGLFSSCSAEESDLPVGETQSITVLIPQWMGAHENMMFNIASEIFTETYGIEVELYPGPTFEEAYGDGTKDGLTSYREKLFADIMRGKGPDVFFDVFTSTGVFEDLFKKMDAGAFYDMNKFIEIDSNFDLSPYEEGVLNAGIYKGNRYFMPLSYSVPVLVASGEELDALDLDAEDFSTYDKFITTWENIRNGSDVLLLSLSGDWGEGFILEEGWLGECLDFENGVTNFEVSSFRRLIDLFISENRRNTTPYEEGAVYEGRLFTLARRVFELVTRPELAAVEEEDMVVIPIPNAYGNVTAEVYDYCMISSTTGNPDAAWNFVKLLMSEEVQQEMCRGSRYVPIKSSLIDQTIEAQFVDTRDGSVRYSDVMIDKMKELHHIYDNVVWPWQNHILYRRIAEYVTSSALQDFDAFKSELENFYNIYMSE